MRTIKMLFLIECILPSTLDNIQHGFVRSTNGTVSAFEKWAVSWTDFLTVDPYLLELTPLPIPGELTITKWLVISKASTFGPGSLKRTSQPPTAEKEKGQGSRKNITFYSVIRILGRASVRFPHVTDLTFGSSQNSLEFRSFGLSKTGGQIQVRQLTLFDGVTVSYCDNFKEDRTQYQNCKEAYGDILASFSLIQRLLNMTVDVIQRQRGCVCSTNGTVSAFEKWAVSGIEFLTFDPYLLKWTSQSPSANAVEQSWNKRELWNREFSHFLKFQCPSMTQNMKLKSTAQSTDQHIFAKPVIFAKPIPNTAKVSLRCHVTSCDRSLKVYLTRNGAPMVNQVGVNGPLPTGDGAVIFRRTAEIFTNHNSAYVCAVQTGNNNISVLWDGHTLDGRRITSQIIAQNKWKMMTIVFGFSILVLITFGIWKMVKVRHPEIRNIFAADLFGENLPEEHEEVQERWVEMNMIREEND